MAAEPDLRLARLYGNRGQKQFGGDVIADCQTGGTAVAQCKCQEKLGETDVSKACDDFYKHLEHWKVHDPRRFILVVACDATATKVVDEIAIQKKRFRRRKIDFDTWDRAKIVQKLRLQRGLVHQYLGGSATWVSILCGPQEHLASVSSSTSDAERQLLQLMLASHVEAELRRLKEVLRRGQRVEVRVGLKAVRDNPRKWALLDPKAQAAALRLQAALELDSEGDVEKAKSNLAEASWLDPDVNVIRLETRIRLIDSGPEEAIRALPPEDDLETLCARGSVLIVQGNADEAVRTLNAARERDPKDADALRLLALAHWLIGDLGLAQRLLAELMSIAPDWEIVRRTKALINYVSTLASPHLQTPASALPEPVEWCLVRRDDDSLRRLAESEQIFDDLLTAMDRPRGDRQTLEIWKLATIANHPNRQKEAEAYCAKIVEQHPCNIYALPWAMARGYQVDFDRIAKIADVETARNPAELGPVIIATASKIHAKDEAAAAAVLELNKPRFQQPREIDMWNYWWAMVLALRGDSEGALAFINSLPEATRLKRIEVLALRVRARDTGDAGPLTERLGELYGSTAEPMLLFELCNQYAAAGNWAAVTERSTELLERVPTPDALWLATIADYNTRNFERCIRRTDQYRNWFPANQLPVDLRRIRVGCLERRGPVHQALDEAKSLVREDANPETIISFMRLCMRFGDVQEAIARARELVNREEVTPEQRIAASELLLPFAPDLSRQFLRPVLASPIPAQHVPSALQLGTRLELERDMRGLWQRGAELAKEGTFIKQLDQQEVEEWSQQRQRAQTNVVNAYESGQVPIHLLIDAFRFNLPEIYWMESKEDFSPLEQPHVLVRNGRRSGQTPLPKFPKSSRLNLDVTSLLLIQRFELWEHLNTAFAEIRISGHVIPFLQETLRWTESHQPAWDRARREVISLCQSGHIDTDPGDADCALQFQVSLEQPDHLNPRFVAEELRLRGAISNDDFDRAIEALVLLGHKR